MVTPQKPSMTLAEKRRASISPDKLRMLEPLRINTNLTTSQHVACSKRMKTTGKLEIEYDNDGIPRVKQTPATPATSAAPGATTPSPDPDPLNNVQDSSEDLQSSDSASSASTSPTTTNMSSETDEDEVDRFSLMDAFVEDSSLCILLVGYLDVPSLISLYAISKDFHRYFNRNATAFILESVRTWAPMADKIFPWRCYQSLCIKDPIKRQKGKAQALGADIEQFNLFSRDVPSLRWLQMVVWREGVAKDMVIQLMTKALRTPFGTRETIKVSHGRSDDAIYLSLTFFLQRM
jgi:hypothetical protein